MKVECICAVIVLVLVCSTVSDEVKKQKLQIGVKHRVDPEQCKIKSKKGDTLHMHYTVSILKFNF